MAKKFYVVWQGRTPGIYTDWNQAKAQVDKFPGARYKSFPSASIAEQAFHDGHTPAQTHHEPQKAHLQLTASLEEAYDVAVYCDGGCEPNPGEAGSGVAVYRYGKLDQLLFGLYNPSGTNNTAELNALYQALVIAQDATVKKQSVVVLSDSQYSINCISKWAPGWEAKGWTKSGGEIKNLNLIQRCYALYNQIKDKIELHHVKAHAGTEGNELADRLSILAVDQQEREFKSLNKPYDIQALLKLRAG